MVLWLGLMATAAGLLWPGRFGPAALAMLAATFCFTHLSTSRLRP